MDLFQKSLATVCPNGDSLAAFSHGRLPDEQLVAIAEHVSACLYCARGLEVLQAEDKILARLRGTAPGPAVDEALCARMAEQACALVAVESMLATKSDAGCTVTGPGPRLPVVFGPYLLLEQLGHGSMGVVFKARQESLKRLVAVKMIRAGAYANANERLRFCREGEAIARIRHAHVVQIHEFGEQEGQLYFSMELLEGGSLAGRLRNSPLAEREAAELVRTLALAVAAAHEQGVVHRDLKPGNVMFAADGSVKITDFGLAKMLDGSDNVTCTDGVVGTPAYMAPEQARGESRKIGPATDVYALGVILYEALTGKPPHKAANRLQTLELVRTREPEPPSRLCPKLSRDLEAICLKCLERGPEHRYPSAAALAEELDNWLRGEPTKVRPQGRAMRLWRRLRRRPWFSVAAALLLFGAVAVPTGVWWRKPDRPIRAIESELARGRAQTLIGETQGPRWSRWRVGQSTSRMSVLSDGAFTLSSDQAALLELVRDPQRPHYRYRALVRHDEGASQSEIGIYLAHHPHALPAGVTHQFAALTFHDIARDIDRWTEHFSVPRPIKAPPPPKGNRAMLAPHLCGEGESASWTSGMPVRRGPYFDPTGAGGQEWRELEMEVTPQGVWGSWGGKSIGPLTEDELVEQSLNYQSQMRKKRFRVGVVSVYSPRGGLGLYVRHGTAAFRRVVIEPLEDPK